MRRLATLLLLLVLAVPARAETPHDLLRKSIVLLELSYLPSEGPDKGVRQAEQATGFFVSKDGFILTAYHLFKGLDQSKGINMTLKATVGGVGSPFVLDAAVVNALRPLDLLLLKVRVNENIEFVPVRLGRSEQVQDQQIFSSGFHGLDPFAIEGTVANRLGPNGVGHLWALQMPVASGQSGSPTYLSDGTVVGMLKGNSATAGAIGFMIPIEYADALIAHLRVSELLVRIARLEASMRDVGTYYQWSGYRSGGRIVVKYDKLITGDPHVAKVAYEVIPFFTEEDETRRASTMDLGELSVAVSANGKGGEVVIERIQDILANRLSGTPKVTAVPRMEVRIIPIAADGTRLPPATATIEWAEE